MLADFRYKKTSECYSQHMTHAPCPGRFRLRGATDIFFCITLHDAPVHVLIVCREVPGDHFDPRNHGCQLVPHGFDIEEVGSIYVGCWLAVGPEETPQNLPSGNNRCTGAIQLLRASFGSAYQPNTFFRVVCLNSRCCTTQIFTHDSFFSIFFNPKSLFA